MCAMKALPSQKLYQMKAQTTVRKSKIYVRVNVNIILNVYTREPDIIFHSISTAE